MPPLPDNLPSNMWGFASLAIVCVAAVVMALAKRSSGRSQLADNDDEKLQVVTDALLGRMSSELEKRDGELLKLRTDLDALQAAFSALEAKYRSALRYARALALIDPSAAKQVRVPQEIRDDL